MKHRHEVTLQQLLDARTAGIAIATSDPGDRALLGQRYEEAVEAYGKQENPSKTHRAKQGYALAMLGRNDEAIELLNRDNVGTHHEALAVLAWALWHGGEAATSRHPHRESCKDLLLQVQAHPEPSAVACRILLKLWFSVGIGGRPEQEAERAVRLHPQHGHFVVVLARERRMAGRADAQTLELLIPFLDARIAGILEEAFQTSLHLGRQDVLKEVLSRLRASSAGTCGHASERRELDKLVAYSELALARGGDATAAPRGWELIAPLIPTASQEESQRHERGLDTCRLAICLAAEMKDEAAIQSAVSALVRAIAARQQRGGGTGRGRGCWRRRAMPGVELVPGGSAQSTRSRTQRASASASAGMTSARRLPSAL
ncbi:hypothetical protein [Luteimonas sp. MHLX1A]|uniref:hypothetical protein n=1 Tax=Alterluteimonas muca TaxID=2878684 RepID=UPI001E492017|nr:hypothetical protein [Luteimonas sp. MHLX1A]MCD9047888.1 hypothetical protein [Luteimonas sp. MHLX1A]